METRKFRENGSLGFVEYSESENSFEISAGKDNSFSFDAQYLDGVFSFRLSGKGGEEVSAQYELLGKENCAENVFLRGAYCPGKLGYERWVFPLLIDTLPVALGYCGANCAPILNVVRKGVFGDANYSRAEEFLLELANPAESFENGETYGKQLEYSPKLSVPVPL